MLPPQADSPAISIIMPAYNGARYLPAAIESVLAQNHTDWELIILDDASTDSTAMLVQPYLKDTRIKYQLLERHPHSSAARVRNIGITQAQGKYIAFLDVDDCFYPGALDALIRVIQGSSACLMAQGFYSSIDEHGEKILTLGTDLQPLADGQYILPDGFTYNWKTMLDVQFPCLLGTALFRRDVFESIGLFSEQLSHSEDFEFFIRLYHAFPQGFYAIPMYTCQYRLNPASLTKAGDQCQRQIDCHFQLLNNLFEHSEFAPQIAPYKTYIYTRWYRRFSRQQLNTSRPERARDILKQAWKNPGIPRFLFFRELAPLWLQSFMTPTLYGRVATLKREFFLKKVVG